MLLYEIVTIYLSLIAIAGKATPSMAQKNFGDEICINPRFKFLNERMAVYCVTEEDVEFWASLKKPSWEWRAETASAVDNTGVKYIVRSISLKNAGNLECILRGKDPDGSPIQMSMYHYIMPLKMPNFFTVLRMLAYVDHCDENQINYLTGVFGVIETPKEKCKKSSDQSNDVCILQPKIHCKKDEVTVDITQTLYSIGVPPSYVPEAHFNVPKQQQAAKLLQKRIARIVNKNKRIKTYLKKVSYDTGFGYLCPDGYFQDRDMINNFTKAIKHGSRPLLVRYCMPCPAGTAGTGGLCSYCSPKYYSDSLGRTTCLECPSRSTLSYTGAVFSDECSSNTTERPQEFPVPCPFLKANSQKRSKQ